MEEAILRLFKSLVVTDPEKMSNVPNKKALEYGVFISDDFYSDIIASAIKMYGRNGEEANQTFHKSLFKVATAELTELYFEQLLHYFTTYGAEELGIYNQDSVFIPREKLEIPELEKDTELIVIKPITEKELKERLDVLLTSNIALSKQTVKDIVTLSDYIDINRYSDGDYYFSKIKNKEVKTALCGKLGILPKRCDEFLRYLLAKLCDSTLLIKDKATIGRVAFVDNKELLNLLERYKKQYGLIPLAESFNRFKPLFLAMKRKPQEMIRRYYTNEDLQVMKKLNRIVNDISRLSKEHHKPLKENDLNRFVEWCDTHCKDKDFDIKLINLINDAGVFTLIKLLNYLRYKENNTAKNVYKIRNGKVYVKGTKLNKYTKRLEEMLITILEEKVKDKTIYVPHSIDYKLPQSEKQYVGNIPFGSSIELDKQSLVFGIHWVNIKDDQDYEHRVDLDIHLNSKKHSIGWCSDYRKGDYLLFTGDNTDAPAPLGASEFIYIDNAIEDDLFNFKINNYTTDVGDIPYEIIIGTADKKDISNNRNFVIDPNNVIMKIPMEIEKGKSEQVLGVIDIKGDKIKLIFTDLSTSNLPVSRNNNIEESVREYVKELSNTQISVEEILQKSGAILTCEKTAMVEVPYVVDDEDMKLITIEEAEEKGLVFTGDDIHLKKEERPVDIDLSLEALTKDSFIRLLQIP